MATSAKAASFSSSLNSIPLWKYHVFLSFRGEDTRKGFTDHLYAALQQKGIITFKDDEELGRGEAISQELLRAIEESLSSIVILSQNYASSTWCLDELLKILESRKFLGREVFPIFYNIDPYDVRQQRGSFADAFRKHNERFTDDKEKVQKWRDALYEVANISGYDSKDRHERKLIEEIVAEVFSKLQPKLPTYNNELVGINSKLNEIYSLVGIRLRDVRFIGIWGMGGIGKTTLARFIYERICNQFDICCFLADVREVSEGKGLAHLQRQFLSDLKLSNLEFVDAYEGKKIIINHLCNQKVLVVLDDVSEMNQLENLILKRACLCPGSRVIVTTREMHLFTTHGEFETYEVKFLNNDESLQLLCQRAFKKDKPVEGYLELSKSVVQLAGGLPLTLEVLGCYLCGRTILEWKDALEKIKKLPPQYVLRRLRISYEALDDMQKKIFLDIACFFKGMAKDQVTQILEICGLHPTIGIKELVEKCLLTEYDVGVTRHLGMHDILQEMGKSIVFQESPNDASRRSRLWSKEDIDHILTKDKGSELIEVILLQFPKPYEACWDPQAFSKIYNLRILIILCNVHLPRGLKCLPSSLKILNWKGYPLTSLPLGVHLNELVDITLHYSNIIQLWTKTQMSEKLRFIDLSHSKDLLRTPTFSMLPNLEKLVLEGCIKLVQVHPSLGQHKKLVVVNLNDCQNLKALPSKLEMDSLKDFILSGCSKVKKLPEFRENMECLSVLELKNCKNLICLPRSICNLKSLKILNIFGCSKFVSLPNNLNENDCLEELDVSGTAIKEVPSSIVSLQNLKVMCLSSCKGPTSSSWNLTSPFQRLFGFSSHEVPRRLILPPSLSSLFSLKHLDLSYCNLCPGSIPNDLGCLPSLVYLDLSGNNFGNLPSGSWVLPPSFSSLSSLQRLYLRECNLCDGSIPNDLNCLSLLFALDLSGNNFTNLPASLVSNLLHLRYLFLYHCPRLQLLPKLPRNLKCLEASGCHSLEPISFPELLLNFTESTHFKKSFPFGYHASCIQWLIPGGEVPSWFDCQNFQFLDKFNGFRCRETPFESLVDKNEALELVDSIVSMKVDIPQFCGSIESWGIAVCNVVQDMSFVGSEQYFIHGISWSSTAPQVKFLPEQMEWRMSMECNESQLIIRFLPCNDARAASNQIELIFYTAKVPRANVGGKFIIKKCGWRVTCTEDLEEWRRTNSEPRLAKRRKLI